MRKLSPIHPGEILSEDFLKEMGISQTRLARDIGVPARRINEICRGKRAISADTALRLARFFAMSAEYWMTLQSRFDLQTLEDSAADRLRREVRPLKSRAA
ncbi:MAG: HigA family addiction module antidote protein [Proteobacteria bacterium]|nr:HigA family addiction module antidote protein [Pseudomonadota bacterium]